MDSAVPNNNLIIDLGSITENFSNAVSNLSGYYTKDIALSKHHTFREMETIKDPAMITGSVALITVLGSGTYFYREIEAIKKELGLVSTTVNTLSSKVARAEKMDANRHEILQTLTERIGTLTHRLDQMPTYDDIVETRDNIEDLVTSLQDNNIEIALPSPGGRRDMRRGSTPRSSRFDEDPREARRYGSRGHNPRPSSDHNSRRRDPSQRDLAPASSRDYGNRAVKMPPEDVSHVDDRDLINLVRQQQQNS